MFLEITCSELQEPGIFNAKVTPWESCLRPNAFYVALRVPAPRPSGLPLQYTVPVGKRSLPILGTNVGVRRTHVRLTLSASASNTANHSQNWGLEFKISYQDSSPDASVARASTGNG
jgi:hypothetical protein